MAISYAGRIKPPQNVAPNNAVIAAQGEYKCTILQPDNGDATAVDVERWISETGCMAFRVTPLEQGVVSLDGIVFGWSTTYNDLAAVNSAMAQISGQITTPNGTMVPNVGVILPTVDGSWGNNHAMWYGMMDWIYWDAMTTIKTIAVRSHGADYDKGVLLEVIE